MKKILSLVLALTFLVSTFTLASCGVEKEVSSIYGMTAEEAFFDAYDLINSADRYEVVVDAKVAVDVAFFSIPINIKGFYFYSFDGKNEHHGFTAKGKKFLKNELLQSVASDVFSDLDLELWYVDGMCYVIDMEEDKTKFSADSSPILRSELENDVNYVLENSMAQAKCYKKGDKYFFTLVLEGSDTLESMTTKEVYTIYFNKDGYIDTISVAGTYDGYTVTNTMHYKYKGLDPITAPDDANSFRTTSYYY